MSGIDRWHNRVALVTGASEGIGRAVALRLLERGLRVAVCARRVDRLNELCAAEHAAFSSRCLVIPCDLRDETAIARMFGVVRDHWGGVDVLVNNAGLGHHAPLLNGETDHWREMLEVNVLALSICTREAVADMRKRGDDGHVIHIGSMAGHRVPPH